MAIKIGATRSQDTARASAPIPASGIASAWPRRTGSRMARIANDQTNPGAPIMISKARQGAIPKESRPVSIRCRIAPPMKMAPPTPIAIPVKKSPTAAPRRDGGK